MEQPLSPASGAPSRPAAPEPEISNPAVAEGINVSDKRPLRTFFINLAITAAGILLFVFLLDVAASVFTPYIPFSWEKGLVPESLMASSLDAAEEARQEQLRHLAAKAAAAMDLPADMSISLHYNSSGMVNAFATLGGNVMVFQGLLDHVRSEDGLVMVLAHEIAHVKNRDAIRGIVKMLGMVLLLSGVQDSGAYVEKVMNIGVAGYSRAQEEAADAEAVRALVRIYGHAGGADEFFRVLARLEMRDPDAEANPAFPGITASHPDTLTRLARAREEAARHNSRIVGTLTPLSGALAKQPYSQMPTAQ